MTDQTGAEQQGAAGSRTGDVDVADASRPDVTTDVQSGGATDLDAGGPDAATAADTATTPRITQSAAFIARSRGQRLDHTSSLRPVSC